MNIIKKVFVVAVILNVALKATDNEISWLEIAQRCDQVSSVNYDSLRRTDFTLRDAQGKNIYQIALEKHKATSSIACAKMAVMIEHYEKRIHEELSNEIIAMMETSAALDEVEKTFEVSHKSEN